MRRIARNPEVVVVTNPPFSIFVKKEKRKMARKRKGRKSHKGGRRKMYNRKRASTRKKMPAPNRHLRRVRPPMSSNFTFATV